MKSKLLIVFSIGAMAIATAIVFTVNHFSLRSQLSDLTLQNLEAITEFEYHEGKCPTAYDLPNQYLKLVTCWPLAWQQKLICKPMDGVCCEVGKQKACSGGPLPSISL
jgi:hypothetical protein